MFNLLPYFFSIVFSTNSVELDSIQWARILQKMKQLQAQKLKLKAFFINHKTVGMHKMVKPSVIKLKNIEYSQGEESKVI